MFGIGDVKIPTLPTLHHRIGFDLGPGPARPARGAGFAECVAALLRSDYDLGGAVLLPKTSSIRLTFGHFNPEP
jgi:hypothetical protein